MLILSTNKDQKLLETEFLIAICHLTGNKLQSKAVSSDFDQRLLIIKSIFNCCLSGVIPEFRILMDSHPQNAELGK